MISLRHVLTVALGFLLLSFFLLAIVSCQIGATVLSADFYKDRLSSSDLYTFALTDLTLAVVGDLRRSGDNSSEFEEILRMTSRLSDQKVVASLNRVMPPDRLQNTAEQALDEIVPYMTGDRDGFALPVELRESGETLVEEVKYLLREADAYVSLSETIGEMVAEEVAGATEELELGVTSERIAQAVMTAVTADWLQAQIESSLDEIAPYMRGETDSFEVRLEIREIARRVSAEAKDLLQEAGAYDILYEDVLEPAIADSLFETLGGQSAIDIMERVRSALSGDLVWTEQYLLSLIESETGDEGLQGFQQARTWISSFQSLRWLAWITVVVLLISIGLLGGRNWPGRVSWAAAYMVGIAALLFAAFRALRSMWNSRIEDARVDALGQIDPSSHFPLSQELIIDKGFEVVADAGSVFIDGLARQPLIGLAIGLALLAGVVGWRYWRTSTGKSKDV